ncbi:BspA family leucine-rich repeat surface protein [Lactobacillus sp. ESL0791]|uniref:BspA family leucine-rich repeat surface protein n=1 Tax=Lactobacillus sp. ESL0791 TaxID=2983234 RepID=UPI0023F7415B|nr:BspA family leucine-rich repeat surface protein [Lactobacillus sp. ESL0791]MDF7639782.1 BspA family leucine-rich repeat surface protein [Lactobacillus sp. ESL0791]
MLSKNNLKERQRKTHLQDKQERFSLRKLTVGTASVLLGFSFMQVNSQTAKADTVMGANTTAVNEQKTKQKKQVQANQPNLTTYSGLCSFLRSEPEAPQPSQASQGSAASSGGAESSAAATSSTSSSAGSEAISSNASSSASAPSTGVDAAQPVKAEAQDGVEPRSEIRDKDGQCDWIYNSESRTMTFVADADTGNTLSSTPIVDLVSEEGISPDAIKIIKFDNTDVSTDVGGTGHGQIKLPQNCTKKFANLPGLKEIIGADGLYTSNVTKMDSMFTNDPGLLRLDLHSWDVSQVTSMRRMFSNTTYQTTDKKSVLSSLNLHGWKVDNLSNMFEMFYNLPKLKVLDIENWDTNENTNNISMSHIFLQDNSLVASQEGNLDNGLDLSSWNFKVSDMLYAFGGIFKLKKLDISNLDTSAVTTMQGAFNSDSKLAAIKFGDKWKVDNVTDMSFIFQDDSSLASIDGIGSWDVSKVEKMTSMFDGAANLKFATNDVLDNWNVSKVERMDAMFRNASSLETLNLSNWDTSSVVNMSYMFQGDSRLTTLNLGKSNDGTQKFIPNNNMLGTFGMFDAVGAADVADAPLNLTLGNFKIITDAWGSFKAQNIKSAKAIDGVTTNSGTTNYITFNKLKELYKNSNGPDTNTYVVYLHKHDDERYGIRTSANPPEIYAHKGQLTPITKNVNGINDILGPIFYDGEISSSGPYYSITDLEGIDDYFTSGTPTVSKDTGAKWLDGNSMDSHGNLAGDGVVVVKKDEHGNVVYDDNNNIVYKVADNPKNLDTANRQQGNAVVEVDFGDNTDANGVHTNVNRKKYIPVNVKFPVMTTATQYAQKGQVPGDSKIKNALKVDGISAPEKWQDKWSLSYSWVIKKVDEHGNVILDHGNPVWVPLTADRVFGSDVDVHGNPTGYGPVPNVGIKINYGQPTAPDDGYEVVTANDLLTVKNYADTYDTTFVTPTHPLTAHLATSAVSPTVQTEVLVPSEFKDPTSWGSFLHVETKDFHIVQTDLSDIIQKIEWDNTAAPTTAPLGPQSNIKLKITYKDGSTASVSGAAVTVYGGELDGSHQNVVGINQTDMLSSSTARDTLTLGSVNSITANAPLATYNWSKDGIDLVNPDISQPVNPTEPNAYVIIDYHDDTEKQVVPVKLKVTAISQNYTPLIKLTGITIHATDAADSVVGGHSVPVITTPEAIDNVLTLTDTSSIPSVTVSTPHTKVKRIIWKAGDEPDSAGAATQSHKVIVIYQDGSQSAPIDATFKVEKAEIDATKPGVTPTGSSYTGSFLKGEVPAAGILVKLPDDFVDARCKWVKNDAIHAELSLSDLNDTTGTIDAAIAVTYSDNTHQYLPIKLIIDTKSGINECQAVKGKIVHPNQRLDIDKLVSVTQKGTSAHINHSEYQLAWKDNTAPDLTAASLGNATSKQIHGTIIVTYTADETTTPVDVTITLVGAQKKQNANPKQTYVGNAGLELKDAQVKKVVSHYLDTNAIDSLPSDSKPIYTLTPTPMDNTVALTVTYSDDGSQQTFTDIPLRLVKAQVNNNPIEAVQGSSLGTDVIKQALLNYGEVMATGADVDDQIAGVNSSQVGSRQYGSFKIKYSGDTDWGLPEVTDTIPVTVDIVQAPRQSVDNKPVLKPGSVSVPQYTDLTIHHEYAEAAVTKANSMPAGSEYTWDRDSLPKTDHLGTYKTFVNVRTKDGTFASVPVTIQVVSPKLDEAILMHNAYVYNQDANRVTNRVLQRGLKVKTYGMTMIDGKLYYHLEDNQYVKAGNIDGQTRQIAKTAYVYNHAGKRVEDQVIYKGTKVKTYGAAVKIKHHKYYTLGLGKFIKIKALK